MTVRGNRFYRLDQHLKTIGKEVDLRKENIDTFSGSIYEIPKAYKVLIRRFRRNETNQRISCTCNVAREGQVMQECNICLGEGYLWDEHYVDTFRVEIGTDQEKVGASLLTDIGRTKKQFCKFYLQNSVTVEYEDKVIELKLDVEGKIVRPEIRSVVWTINTLHEKRSDNGRLEYIILYCKKY